MLGDFDGCEKMRDVLMSRFHQVSHRDLCYVSEHEDFRFVQTNIWFEEVSYYVVQSANASKNITESSNVIFRDNEHNIPERNLIEWLQH